MSNIDKRALREAAEKAGADVWCAFIDTKSKTYAVHTPDDDRCGDVVKWPGLDGQQRAAAKARFIAAANPSTVLALLDELEAKDAQITNLTAERDALREGEMGDAKHSNTRAAADIYFQLAEECEIPAGGSLVEHVSELRERADDAEKRIAELEAKLETADKLQDSAFRHGLQHGFSLGQTDNQAGFEQAIKAYGQQWKGE